MKKSIDFDDVLIEYQQKYNNIVSAIVNKNGAWKI